MFSKGRELYGLYLARNAIRDAGRVVVVEGYMDVVALAQHGVEYAVATLGTATTPTHVQKLFRLTDTVVFCFDGDNAGRKAAWRALENTLPVLADGKNAVFLFLPDGEDPDDFVRKRGRAAFEKAQEAAVPLSEFLLAELAARHPPTSAEGRAALVAAARPHLAEINAPVLAAILRRRLSELSGLPEAELRGLLNLPVAAGTSGPAPRAAREDTRPGQRGASFRANVRRPPSLTRELIQGLLLQPALARVARVSQARRRQPRQRGAGRAGRPLRDGRGRTYDGRRPPTLCRFAARGRAGERPGDGRRPRPDHGTGGGPRPRGARALVAAGAAQRYRGTRARRTAARPPRRSSGCASSTLSGKTAGAAAGIDPVRGRLLARREGSARGII